VGIAGKPTANILIKLGSHVIEQELTFTEVNGQRCKKAMLHDMMVDCLVDLSLLSGKVVFKRL
jgi:hypothetical protein